MGLRYAKAERETLVELAVVWEMLNKSVIAETIVVVGDFWQPILDRVREWSRARPSTENRCGARRTTIWCIARHADEAADYLARKLKARE